MKILFFKITVLFLSVLWMGVAHADWISVGVAYQCNESENKFYLNAIIETSSPDSPGVIRANAGFTELKNPTNNIQCSIGKTFIEMKINIIPPQPRGMCIGSGLVDLEEFRVNGIKVFPLREIFNSGCMSEPVLFSIEVDASQILPKVRFCRGKWKWDIGYRDINCEEKIFR